jgi:tetratricopeptide (TPR) repeat protein
MVPVLRYDWSLIMKQTIIWIFSVVGLCLLLMYWGDKNMMPHSDSLEKGENSLFEPDVQGLIDSESWLELTSLINEREVAKKGDRAALARALLESGSYDESLKISEDLMNAGEMSSFVRHVRVRSLLYKKRLDEAEVQSLAWLKKEPDSALAHQALGHCYWTRKDYEKAAAELSLALKGGCDQPKKTKELLSNIYYQLGEEQRDKADFKKAAFYMGAACALEPDDANYYVNLGKMHLELKNFDAALEAFLQASHKKRDSKIELLISDEIRLVYQKRRTLAILEKKYLLAINTAREELKHAKLRVQKRNIAAFIENAIDLYVKELRTAGRFQEIHNFRPEDEEALWELSRNWPEKKRLDLEARLSQGSWESEVCRRRALVHWQKAQKKEACRWMIRHHQIVKGKNLLVAELILFEWLKELPAFSEQLNSESWQEIWQLFQLKKGSKDWDSQMKRVNTLFSERYYIWAYEAEVAWQFGQKEKFNNLALKIAELDPPKKITNRLKELRESALLPK